MDYQATALYKNLRTGEVSIAEMYRHEIGCWGESRPEPVDSANTTVFLTRVRNALARSRANGSESPVPFRQSGQEYASFKKSNITVGLRLDDQALTLEPTRRVRGGYVSIDEASIRIPVGEIDSKFEEAMELAWSSCK